MAKYTTELRSICEVLAQEETGQGMKGYNDIDTVIETARPLIFNFTYPISEDHKKDFETNFLMHFYTREICAETYGRWKLFLRSELNIKMPYYKALWESAKLDYDTAMQDVNVHETGEHSDTGTKNSTGSNQHSGNDITTRTDDLTEGLTHGETITKTYSDVQTVHGAHDEIDNDIVNSVSIDLPSGKEKTTDNSYEMRKYSDTPQSGIDGFGISGSASAGYTTSDTNNYLTNVTVTESPNNTSETSYENRKTVTLNTWARANTAGTDYGYDGTSDSTTVTATIDGNDYHGDVHLHRHPSYTDTEKHNTSDKDEHGGTDTRKNTGTQTSNLAHGMKIDTTDNETTQSSGSTENRRWGLGGSRSASQLLKEYRDTLLNIDELCFSDLADLFINLW